MKTLFGMSQSKWLAKYGKGYVPFYYLVKLRDIVYITERICYHTNEKMFDYQYHAIHCRKFKNIKRNTNSLIGYTIQNSSTTKHVIYWFGTYCFFKYILNGKVDIKYIKYFKYRLIDRSTQIKTR